MLPARATAPSRDWLLSQIPGGEAPIADGEFRAGRPDVEPGMRERVIEALRSKFFSGGAGDVRNVATAMGPAAQAAGGLGGLLQWAARAGVPAKAPVAMDAADQMFDMARAAPLMAGGAGPGAAQAGSANWPLLAAAGGITGVGGYAAYKVKEMMDERARQMEEYLKQIK